MTESNHSGLPVRNIGFPKAAPFVRRVFCCVVIALEMFGDGIAAYQDVPAPIYQ